tara:strand:- start:1212 stop:1622 length:411 start_codon:yes stop_codon:yes gene_type:complete
MARPYLGGTNAGIKELTATNTLHKADSGKMFMLNSAAEFVTTLPAPSNKGWEGTFVVKAAPSGADYRLSCPSGAIKGSISAGAADDVADTSDGSDTTITFKDGSAVVGDYIKLVSDGTDYYIVGGLAKVAAGITIS